MRTVVLLCGPAGCGKTTAALASGLKVYDRDDAQWTGEKQFTQALAQLANDPDAHAVVIRSGSTSSARAKATALVQATHVYLMPLPSPQELAHRIAHRNRADKIHGIASVKKWFQTFDHTDAVALFPGWEHIGTTALSIGAQSRQW